MGQHGAIAASVLASTFYCGQPMLYRSRQDEGSGLLEDKLSDGVISGVGDVQRPGAIERETVRCSERSGGYFIEDLAIICK